MSRSTRRFFRFLRRVDASAKNALEIARLGQLAPDYQAPFDIVDQDAMHRLRRYLGPNGKPGAIPFLLVPPLMVTSQVYDVAPDTSAVSLLAASGLDPFVVDFGAPEDQPGGMQRTLDDHVRTVDKAIDRVRQLTGKDVHVGGYSQGGMFAYQVAAYRRSEGIRSLVTFGSPVDIHRNLPAVHASAVAAMVRALEPVAMGVLDRIEGLPGAITSNGFKLLSTKKEIQQRIEFVTKLHDRSALIRREARRKFLGGGGFVAWPGPALRDFIDQFIVHNRMLSGGFVIDGRSATLADISVPILSFIGLTDDMARPPSVRAIERAAPNAKVDFLEIAAGHFGMVVGSRAMQISWPTVADWIKHVEGVGPRPVILDAKRSERDDLRDFLEDEPEGAGFDVNVEFSLFLDSMAETARSGWRRMGDMTASASDAFDSLKHREPKLRRLADLTDQSLVSAALSLSEQAERTPQATFFLWQGRAFSYAEADQRVSNVVRGLVHCGVLPGDRVCVLMDSRPSFLSMVTAISRLGGVAVLIPPDTSDDLLRQSIRSSNVRAVATDPENVDTAVRAMTEESAMGERRLERKILVLGGVGKVRSFAPGVIDMEAIDPAAVPLPPGFQPNAGRGEELALILLRPDDRGGLRALEVTNHRWALSALGAAAACTLKPEDTVYAVIPLHHPAGILVSVGAALAGGSRLALGRPFSPETFVSEVRRYGGTVVFYAGEMLRALVNQPPSAQDRNLPVRIFAGSGMRKDLWRRVSERFGAGVMEFYASTSERVILANASGEKLGSLGRPMPGSRELTVLRCDPKSGVLTRNAEGWAETAPAGDAGLLAARVDVPKTSLRQVTRDLFRPGDAWFVSSDVVRRDEDGDFWFVDSLAGFFQTDQGAVSTRKVEDSAYSLAEVEMAAAMAVDGKLVLAVASREPLLAPRLSEALSSLLPHERPSVVIEVDRIPLREGFRPDKWALKRAFAGDPSDFGVVERARFADQGAAYASSRSRVASSVVPSVGSPDP